MVASMTGALRGLTADSLGRKNGGKSGRTHVIGETGRTERFLVWGQEGWKGI